MRMSEKCRNDNKNKQNNNNNNSDNRLISRRTDGDKNPLIPVCPGKKYSYCQDELREKRPGNTFRRFGRLTHTYSNLHEPFWELSSIVWLLPLLLRWICGYSDGSENTTPMP